MKNLGLALCIASIQAQSSLAAELRYPVDVAIDAQGTVFIADHEAHALLKITPSGVVALAQGEGLPRTALYGIRHIAPDSAGGFVASDPATMRLYRIDADGSVAPLADDGRFVTPWGVAIESSGAVLVVDRVSHALRRVKPDGVVEDIADIRSPRAVLVDKDEGIVVLTDDNLVRVDAGATKPIGSSLPFEFPHDVVLHPDGNFYVSDGYARAIWRIAPDGSVSTLVQGEPLLSPQGLAVDRRGNLLVADPHAKAIFSITPKGEVSRLAQ